MNDSVSERRFYDYLGFNPRFVKFENNIPRSCLIVILYFVSSLYSVPVVDMIKHKLTKIKSSIIRNSIALEPIYKQIYR